jgi:hypothetical protein
LVHGSLSPESDYSAVCRHRHDLTDLNRDLIQAGSDRNRGDAWFLPAVQTGERWTAGEFHRLRGLLRLQSGVSTGGLEDLAEAQRIAAQQGSALVERDVTADRERLAKAS